MVPKNKTGRSSRSKRKSIAAFFDIDNTLLEVNSAKLYIKYFYDHGLVSFPELARVSFYILLHRLNILQEEKALPKLLGIVSGMNRRKAESVVNEAFEELVKEKINQTVLDKLKEHRDNGHHIVLVTASPVLTSTPIHAYVDADHLLASLFQIKDETYTGECLHLMYGEGKVEPMKQYAKKHKINLNKSYVYADSFTDRVIMELVGNPIAVNPDKQLKSHAKEHGWEIIKH